MKKHVAIIVSVLLLFAAVIGNVPQAALAAAEAELSGDQEGSYVTLTGETATNDPARVPLLVTDKNGQLIYFTEVAGGGTPFAIEFEPPETAESGKATATLYSEVPVSTEFRMTVQSDKEEQKISVSLRIVGDDGEEILPIQTWKVKRDASVFDLVRYAAEESELEMEYCDTDGDGKDLYIVSIDGLAEFDRGPGSGWVYRVNGTGPQAPVDRYILNSGDEVEFLYTTDYGDSEVGNGEERGRSQVFVLRNKDLLSVEKALGRLSFAEDVDNILQITEDLLFDLAAYDVEKQRGFVADVGLFFQAAVERSAMLVVEKEKRPETTRTVEVDGDQVEELLAQQDETIAGLHELLASSTLYKPLLTQLRPLLIIDLPTEDEASRWQLSVTPEAWEQLRAKGMQLGIQRGDWRAELTPVRSAGTEKYQITLTFHTDQEQTAQVQQLEQMSGYPVMPLTPLYEWQSNLAGAATIRHLLPVTGGREEGAWPTLYVSQGEQTAWQAAGAYVKEEQERLRFTWNPGGRMMVLAMKPVFLDVQEAAVKHAWLQEPVTALTASGALAGTAPAQYGLWQPITRADFRRALAHLTSGIMDSGDEGAAAGALTRLDAAVLLAGTSDDVSTGATAAFADWQTIPPAMQEAAAFAASRGWITGRTDGRFDPHAPVTRAEAAVMLYRYWKNIQLTETE